jgi:hypothetical protein
MSVRFYLIKEFNQQQFKFQLTYECVETLADFTKTKHPANREKKDQREMNQV